MTAFHVAAYLVLFVGLGLAFVFVNLLIGRFLRPHDPHPEKQEIYECGEPTIGTSYVQFDLRFYVVALLFLIFDVEVAFFFPWATVFGKATHLAVPEEQFAKVKDGQLTEGAKGIYAELGIAEAAMPHGATAAEIESQAKGLAWFSFLDVLVFFGVVLVGFAYVWWRGDIDWVRAVTKERSAATASRAPPASDLRIADGTVVGA